MADNRLHTLFEDFESTMKEFIRRHELTYPEYNAVVRFLQDLGDAGEYPLAMDVLFESVVNQVNYGSRPGTAASIEGPYYVPNPPVLQPPYELPRRPDEPGDPLVFSGTVTNAESGEPLAGALLDMWQCDANGAYSNIDPSVPEMNLRGKLHALDDGTYAVRTIVPAPYEIPKGGPFGKFLAALGRSAYRPAHLHFTVTAEGHEPLTTQIYFETDEYLNTDVADAVRDGLVIPLTKQDDPSTVRQWDISGPYYTGGFHFKLAPLASTS